MGGQCLKAEDVAIAYDMEVIEETLGVWHEIMRDSATEFEKDTKCNRTVNNRVLPAEKFDPKVYTINEGFSPVLEIKLSLQSTLTNEVIHHDRGLITCEDTGLADCVMDWGEPEGTGIVGRSPMLTLGLDSDKWALVYFCRDIEGQEHANAARQEWVWIFGREPTLAEEDLIAAKAVLKEKMPEFDLEWLEKVDNTDCLE